jgi:hypothetical protein
MFCKFYNKINTNCLKNTWQNVRGSSFANFCGKYFPYLRKGRFENNITKILSVRSSRYQDVFALLVPSCCDKSGTSCYPLVTRLMTVTDLLQVVPTRLIQAVRNKLLRPCCHQLVNNLLRADDIRLVRTTCCESVGIIKLFTRLFWQVWYSHDQ